MKSPLQLTLFLLLLTSYAAYPQKINPFDVKISGQGDASLIFIPGFACSGAVWDETLSLFEPNFTCYTLTMAGFAGVPPQSDITFNHWKSEIAKYISLKKIKQPILVGHSMGGALAMAIAADYPELISKIVVVDALPALGALTNPDFISDPKLDCTSNTTAFTEMEDDRFYQLQKNNLPMMIANTEMHDTVLRWSLSSDRETLAQMYCDFYNTDLRDKITSISCPSLILLESYFINFKTPIEAQFKNLKNRKIAYATKGLHFIMYDDKEWYFSQLVQFISNN